jgi:hypothetical protein
MFEHQINIVVIHQFRVPFHAIDINTQVPMRTCIYKGNIQMQRKPKIFFNTDYPKHLRGLTNNRWRGHRPSRLRPFRGSKFGAANRGRIFSADERAAWARENGYACS